MISMFFSGVCWTSEDDCLDEDGHSKRREISQSSHHAKPSIERSFSFQEKQLLSNGLNWTQKFNSKYIDASHFDLRKFAVLGLGGFGLVRLVAKVSDGEAAFNTFALKSISKKQALSRTTGVSSALMELNCLAALSHFESPFICNLTYAFQDKKFLYMALDYCSLGDLRQSLRNRPGNRFPEYIAKIIISQVILGVEQIHRATILHRDIKPENLLLASNGYLKITDFGVSKRVKLARQPSEDPFHIITGGIDPVDPHCQCQDPASHLPVLVECRSTSGTHGYMCPEIYAPRHSHSYPADYFAIGITMHELVLGQRPFEASAIKQYMQRRSPPITIGHKRSSSSDQLHLNNDSLTLMKEQSPVSVSMVVPEHSNKNGSGSGSGSDGKNGNGSDGKGNSDGKMQMESTNGINVAINDSIANKHSYAYSNHNSTGTTPSTLPLDVLFNCSTISAECKHFIAFLLHFDPKQRAGYCGLPGIKKHPFFKSFDWEAVETHKRLHPYDLDTFVHNISSSSRHNSRNGHSNQQDFVPERRDFDEEVLMRHLHSHRVTSEEDHSFREFVFPVRRNSKS